MADFKTKYDSHARVYQHPGSRVKDVYTAVYDDLGHLDLAKSGQEDLYGYIQSHAESVDIHLLIERFVRGDTDALARAQGFYVDASDMPKTYAEVLNSVIAGEQTFDRLPAEVKQRFGNSFSVWLSAFDQPDFSDRMGWSSPAASPSSPANSQVAADFVSDTPSPASPPSST